MEGLDHLVGGIGEIPGTPLHGAAIAALAVVFLWSGAVKARRPWMTAMAIVDFGVGGRPRIALAGATAAAEMLLGAAFVAALWAPAAVGVAVGALGAVLLTVFAALIARALRHGRSFACFCFGDAGDRLSRATFARAAGLAVVAAAVAAASTDAAAAFSGEEAMLALVAGVSTVGFVTVAVKAAATWRLPRPPEGRAGATLLGPAR